MGKRKKKDFLLLFLRLVQDLVAWESDRRLDCGVDMETVRTAMEKEAEKKEGGILVAVSLNRKWN